MTYRLLASGLGILRYPWRRAILTYMLLTAGPSTLGYLWKRAILTHRLLAGGLDTSGYLWRRAILTFRLVAAGRSMLRYLWRRAILQCRLLASGLGLFRYFCRRAILTYRLWAAGLGTLRYPWRRAILLFRLLAAGLSKSRLGYFGDGKSSNTTVIHDTRSKNPSSVVLPLLGKLCNIWQSLKDNIRTLCICSCVPEAIPCTLFLLETFYRKGYGHCRRPRPGIRNSRIGIQFFDSVHCASGQGFIDSFFSGRYFAGHFFAFRHALGNRFCHLSFDMSSGSFLTAWLAIGRGNCIWHGERNEFISGTSVTYVILHLFVSRKVF